MYSFEYNVFGKKVRICGVCFQYSNSIRKETKIQQCKYSLEVLSFFVQGQRDQSVTFGFREGLSTLDIRQSTNEDLETIRREVYVRRPSSRTSTNSGEETTPPGN